MKLTIIIGLFVVLLLFGCSASTPWGDFSFNSGNPSVTPDNSRQTTDVAVPSTNESDASVQADESGEVSDRSDAPARNDESSGEITDNSSSDEIETPAPSDEMNTSDETEIVNDANTSVDDAAEEIINDTLVANDTLEEIPEEILNDTMVDEPSGSANGSNFTLIPLNWTFVPIHYFNFSTKLTASRDTLVFLKFGTGSFRMEIDGITLAVFDQVGVIVRPGETYSPDNVTDLLMGDYPAHSPRDVVIKTRVTPNNRELENWRQYLVDGNVQRKNFAIIILDQNLDETERFEYSRGWPNDYQLIVTPDTYEEQFGIVSESVQKN